jgi:hypothetical protein
MRLCDSAAPVKGLWTTQTGPAPLVSRNHRQGRRLVIPKALHDRFGLRPGEVEVVTDGSALRVEPLAGDEFEEQDGRRIGR